MRRSHFSLAAPLAALVFSGLLSSASAQSTAQPLPDLSAGTRPGGWRFVGLPTKPEKRATHFEVGLVDGQTGVRMDTQSSYGTWVHVWNGPAGTLQWRWRLDTPLSGGVRAADIRRKDGDDAALKVCVMFDHPLDRVPFGERTLLRLARSVSGENLPAATVCYLWNPLQAVGTQGANAFTRRVRYVVLQGPEAPLKQWLAQSRDVAADFLQLFGDELPKGSDKGAVPMVSGVVIGADSDNTQAKSSGWVAGLGWVSR
jgi:Protein of unknown function (DUF3047)